MKTSTSNLPRYALMALLITEAVTVTVPVMILGKYFNFPDILREPAAKAFELFEASQPKIVLGYYIFMLSALVFIPLSYAIKNFFLEKSSATALRALTVLGATVAIVQSIGFIRWIFTMPYLTNIYFAHPEDRATVAIMYETLNRYAGMSIGEHLGFLAMGSWTILLGVIIMKSGELKKWIGVTGIATGMLILVSVAEHFGGAWSGFFGTINFAANAIWTLWIMVISIQLYLQKAE